MGRIPRPGHPRRAVHWILSPRPSPLPEGVYVVSVVGDIALRCPRRVQRRNSFECRRHSVIRSARYYAGGDGAARHPYHHANRFVPLKR